MIDHGYGVTLRSLASDDEGFLYRWRNDPRVRRWTRQNDELTWEAHDAWFRGHQTDSSVRMYGVWAEEGAQCPGWQQTRGLIGVCGLTSLDLMNRRAEFSLYIGPEFHRLGFGAKTLKTLLHHAFMTLGLNCVWGESFESNPAQAMFQKLGMKKEGERREFYYRDGRFISASLWSILRADWDRGVRGGVGSTKPLIGGFISGIGGTLTNDARPAGVQAPEQAQTQGP